MKIIDLLFPPKCCICDNEIENGSVCRDCMVKFLSKISLRKFMFDVDGKEIEAACVFDYNDKDVQRLLFALKKDGNRDLFCFAAGLYRQALPIDFCGIVTNVPRRRANVRIYGYDHVKQPLKLMCRSNSSVKYEALLARKGLSREQKKLSSKQRALNTHNKFKAINKDIQTNILVADDVVTTGSTIVSCAREIIKSNPDAKLYFAFLAAQNGFFPANANLNINSKRSS